MCRVGFFRIGKNLSNERSTIFSLNFQLFNFLNESSSRACQCKCSKLLSIFTLSTFSIFPPASNDLTPGAYQPSVRLLLYSLIYLSNHTQKHM